MTSLDRDAESGTVRLTDESLLREQPRLNTAVMSHAARLDDRHHDVLMAVDDRAGRVGLRQVERPQSVVPSPVSAFTADEHVRRASETGSDAGGRRLTVLTPSSTADTAAVLTRLNTDDTVITDSQLMQSVADDSQLDVVVPRDPFIALPASDTSNLSDTSQLTEVQPAPARSNDCDLADDCHINTADIMSQSVAAAADVDVDVYCQHLISAADQSTASETHCGTATDAEREPHASAN